MIRVWLLVLLLLLEKVAVLPHGRVHGCVRGRRRRRAGPSLLLLRLLVSRGLCGGCCGVGVQHLLLLLLLLLLLVLVLLLLQFELLLLVLELLLLLVLLLLLHLDLLQQGVVRALLLLLLARMRVAGGAVEDDRPRLSRIGRRGGSGTVRRHGAVGRRVRNTG